MDLSIIVPVYNVEKYVRPCLESIYKQGIDESRYEVIIVNDGSTDKSMETIADIIQQHANITVINHPQNLSLSVARNTGIAAAKGEYILMPDSDDLLIENTLLPLIDKAVETKVDLVMADYLPIKSDDIPSFSGVSQETLIWEEKTGGQLFLEDMKPEQCYVWRTLYRRTFLLDNHITFIPGINYQDIPYTQECHLKAQRCIRAHWKLYIYRLERPGAATTYFHVKKARSFILALAGTYKLRKLPHLSPEVRYKLEENVYFTFSTIIYRIIYSITKSSERRYIMKMLKDEVPDLTFTHGTRQKVTSFMFHHMPNLFIELYYLYGLMAFKKVWKIWKR